MAEFILIAVGIYAGIGLLFGIWFVLAGVGTLDVAAAHSAWSFRAMILPGVAALWPIVLTKWLAARRSGAA